MSHRLSEVHTTITYRADIDSVTPLNYAKGNGDNDVGFIPSFNRDGHSWFPSVNTEASFLKAVKLGGWPLLKLNWAIIQKHASLIARTSEHRRRYFLAVLGYSRLMYTFLLLPLASGCSPHRRLADECQQVQFECERGCYEQCEIGSVRKLESERQGPQETRVATNNWSARCNTCRTQCKRHVSKCQETTPLNGTNHPMTRKVR